MIAFYICAGVVVGFNIGMLYCAVKIDRIIKRYEK